VPARRPRVAVHIGLFLATFPDHDGRRRHQRAQRAHRPIADGLSYSVPLLLILLCHELGHYLVARAHGVDASLPYFIPLPRVGFRDHGRGDRHARRHRDRKKLIDIAPPGRCAGSWWRSGDPLRPVAVAGEDRRRRQSCKRGTRSCTRCSS